MIFACEYSKRDEAKIRADKCLAFRNYSEPFLEVEIDFKMHAFIEGTLRALG